MKLYTEESPDIIFQMQNRDPFFDYLTAKIVAILKKKQNGRVLDLGCGSGRNALTAAGLGFEAIGIDTNSVALDIAKRKAKEQKVDKKTQFFHKDILKLKPRKYGIFDVCILQEVIEHIPQYQNAIDVAYASLKPGGVLVLTTPNDPAQWNILDDYAEHVRRFTATELKLSLSAFSHVSIGTVGFPCHRMIITAYSHLLRARNRPHTAGSFRNSRMVHQLYYVIGSLALRIDDLFHTQWGTTLVALAEK